MAQKRMFSKSITNSSRFLMMPQSSQNLYFHLGMNADDDGFCEHFTIMRMTESKPDDLKILQAKQFIQVFDDHVLIILDWKENNLIRSDRYTASKYLEIYKNEIKQISSISGIPDVIPFDNQMEPQVRLGKVRLDNICNSDELPIEEPIYYKNQYFTITSKQHNKYKDTYKNIDIDMEYKKMEIWLDSNPARRKTQRGYPKFISGWLSRVTPVINEKPQLTETDKQLQKLKETGTSTGYQLLSEEEAKNYKWG